MHSFQENPRLRWAALAALLLIAAFAVWLFVIRDDGNGGGGSGANVTVSMVGPEEMTTAEVQSFAAAQSIPVYWAGDKGDTALEVTRTEDGSIYVRYLEVGAVAGDPSPDFLTVGSYPIADAYGLTSEISKRDDAIVGRTHDGGLIVTTKERPESVYIAYPDTDVQIEVYDPNGKRSIKLASSGQIVTVQ